MNDILTATYGPEADETKAPIVQPTTAPEDLSPFCIDPDDDMERTPLLLRGNLIVVYHHAVDDAQMRRVQGKLHELQQKRKSKAQITMLDEELKLLVTDVKVIKGEVGPERPLERKNKKTGQRVTVTPDHPNFYNLIPPAVRYSLSMDLFQVAQTQDEEDEEGPN
jgi:hypothetical protein